IYQRSQKPGFSNKNIFLFFFQFHWLYLCNSMVASLDEVKSRFPTVGYTRRTVGKSSRDHITKTYIIVTYTNICQIIVGELQTKYIIFFKRAITTHHPGKCMFFRLPECGGVNPIIRDGI